MKAADEYLKPYHLHYKDPSERDSYSSYRAGYSDAMDIAEQAIKQAQKDAYNQALIDAAESAEAYFDYNDIPRVGKQTILRLKK